MSDERQLKVGPWIAALLIALPVMYVASFGPACWWFSKPAIDLTRVDDYDVGNDGLFDLWRRAPRAYWPLGWLAAVGPRPISRPLCWYATPWGQRPVAMPCDWQCRRWMYPD